MASTPATGAGLGPHVRLRDKEISELPAHTNFTSSHAADGVQRQDISSYALAVLNEAESFMSDYLPKNAKIKSKDKASSPSTAKVEVMNLDIKPAVRLSGSEAVTESWFARTSLHENAAKQGTASWDEFDSGTRKNHAERELAYTPDVKDAHLVMDWSAELAQARGKVGDWEDVQAEVREMRHHIPPPLNNRVFSVMVVTGRRKDQLLVVQLPVVTKGLAGSKYSSDEKVTAGHYVSVEVVELVNEGKTCRWRMATASNAKGEQTYINPVVFSRANIVAGNLPMFIQKLALPDAVAKDVGLFMDWISKQRHREA